MINGVTTTTAQVYTQSFGAAVSAPPVSTGSIGLGTLTGQIGVVKTGSAKSEGVRINLGGWGGRGWGVGAWVFVMVVGGGGFWGLFRRFV